MFMKGHFFIMNSQLEKNTLFKNLVEHDNEKILFIFYK